MILSRTNKYFYPRCHLASQLKLCPQRDTSISPATDVSLTSQNTLPGRIRQAFDCALSGPFDDLFFTRLAPFPGSLWKHHHRYLRVNGFHIAYYSTSHLVCQELFDIFYAKCRHHRRTVQKEIAAGAPVVLHEMNIRRKRYSLTARSVFLISALLFPPEKPHGDQFSKLPALITVYFRPKEGIPPPAAGEYPLSAPAILPPCGKIAQKNN